MHDPRCFLFKEIDAYVNDKRAQELILRLVFVFYVFGGHSSHKGMSHSLNYGLSNRQMISITRFPARAAHFVYLNAG